MITFYKEVEPSITEDLEKFLNEKIGKHYEEINLEQLEKYIKRHRPDLLTEIRNLKENCGNLVIKYWDM